MSWLRCAAPRSSRAVRVATALLLVASGSCSLFEPGRMYDVTGSFAAVRDVNATPTPDSGMCTAVIDGQTNEAQRYSAFFDFTSSFTGRADLSALEVTCYFGTAYEDGYLQITIPNVVANTPVATQTYTVLELKSGSWSSQLNPGVAWAIGRMPPLRSGFLSSRSGTVTITYADSNVVRGTFTIAARSERAS